MLDVTDPTGDDNGPGTYAYPTCGDFQPGAFDLTGFEVNQTATDVYIQVDDPQPVADVRQLVRRAAARRLRPRPGRERDLDRGGVPAAQLRDRVSRRLEPADRGPGLRVRRSGWTRPATRVGSPQFVVDDPSGTATLILPRAAFGTVGSGWTFTVALTGQDGFSGDQARSFAPTPQPFQFGVCAPGGTSPICSVDPNTVPKVMDTIPPSGVSQATELDPTHPPVTIHGVSVP